MKHVFERQVVGAGDKSARPIACATAARVAERVFGPAGCPVAVGNLWDVTDRDIDRFGHWVLSEWLRRAEAGETVSVADAVTSGRQKCRLRHLIGAAPVCYGLPSVLGQRP